MKRVFDFGKRAVNNPKIRNNKITVTGAVNAETLGLNNSANIIERHRN